jgi:hypothetical protein
MGAVILVNGFKLDRKVAIRFLPEWKTGDKERFAR